MLHRYSCLTWVLAIALLGNLSARADAPASTIIEAHKFLAEGAIAMRDKRDGLDKSAIYMFGRGDLAQHDLVKGSTKALPAGDYLVTAWVEFVPVSTQNLASATITAGKASRKAGAAHFNVGGFTPVTVRMVHPGGPVPFSVAGSAGIFMNGIRTGQSAEEKEEAAAIQTKTKEVDKRKPDAEVDKLDLEDAKDVTSLKFDEVRLVCSKIEFKPVRLAPAIVSFVDVDKIHYLPGETVKATCTVQGGAGSYKLLGELVREADEVAKVFEQDIQIAGDSPQTVNFDFKLDDKIEFGHAIRCSLQKAGATIHSNDQVFGVSKNVYRVGITGYAGPQDRSKLTMEDAEKIAKANKAVYANYFECFAWAPCDFCEMTPDKESFFSGQTQYHGSVSGFKNLLAGAHKYGVKGITYGKSTACGIDAANLYLKHPQWFGGGSGDFDSFYLEREFYDEYIMDAGNNLTVKWQHWANWWVNDADRDAVNYGCDELVRSAKMFGWDGVRWDGHYVGGMKYFNERMLKQIPNFLSGYNVAFANPGTPLFLPSLPVADFHEIAKDHGLMMDESIRDWTLGSGEIRPYYDSISREADYEKRIGGLPLFIEFDRATRQDNICNILWGLAAGQRYTYGNTCGDFNAGPLTRFLTRYSAFVWDDTARIKDPAKTVSVTVPADQIPQPKTAPVDPKGKPAKPTGPVPPGPWFDQTTWLRKLADGRQQLLVNVVNPPNYNQFCSRVEPPSTWLKNVAVKAQIPAGAKLLRTFCVSVDNLDGLIPLEAKIDGSAASVVIPDLKFWAIVVFEIGSSGNGTLAYPAYELTTPVEDAAKVLADQEKEKALAAEQAAKAAASGVAKPVAAPAKPWFDDYANPRNVDLENEKKVTKPLNLALMRNGLLDVTHVKGLYAWMNPIENAVGLAGGGNVRNAYANHAGWRVGPEGCMENYPNNYREMLSQDVVILDNSLATDIGNRNRVMLADFVRNGGGLIVLSGCNSLSCGTDNNSFIGDMLPVTIKGRRDTVTENKGWNFSVTKNDVFTSPIDWSGIQVFTVDASPLKDDVQVIAKVGDRPAIVTRPYGKGRVICFLINFEGDYAEGAKPFWLSAQWPVILADAIKWAAGDYKAVIKPVPTKKVADPTKAAPIDLLLNGDSMAPALFSKKLLEARDNVEDAASAATLIQAAAENPSKLTDNDMLVNLVNDLELYIDDSFAPLAEKVTKLRLDSFRIAGFTMLRKCSGPNTRELLESALKEPDQLIVREALAALAHLKDPASIPAIKTYLAKGGKDQLLAYTALRMMGDNVDLEQVLNQYVKSFNRVTALMAYRKSLFETLYGGTSFKLTLADRKRYERQYIRAQITEKDAIFDNTTFRMTLNKFTDPQADLFTKFVASTDDRAAGSIAFSALPNLTPEQKAKFTAAMSQAKLPQLRMLASTKG